MTAWGVPWHGQWRGTQLTLPNGSLKSWATLRAKQATLLGTTSNIPDTWGNAHLVKVPGVQPVTRTAEELAADYAAGMAWRNTASLSGGRQNLHSKQLDGWIYIDTNGDRWLARCIGFDENLEHDRGAPFSGTLTLDRFGAIGHAAESHSYPVAFADWGIDAPMVHQLNTFPDKVRILRDAYRPDGGRVIGAVHARYANVTSAPNIRRVFSFLELSITGPGSAAVVSISVLRKYSEVISYTPSATTGRTYSYAQLVDPETGAVSYEFAWGRPGRAREDWVGEESSGAFSWSWRELLAVWYDSAGTPVDVAFELSATATTSAPVLSIAPADALDGHLQGVSQYDGAATISLTVGGVPVDTVQTSYSRTATYSGGSVTTANTATIDGQQYSSTGIAALSTPEVGGGQGVGLISPYVADVTSYYTETEPTLSRALSVPQEAGWKVNIAPQGYLLQQSRQVMSLMWGDATNLYTIRPAVTPSGLVGGKTTGLSAWRYYGAWCPQTGQALVMQASPVCFV